MHAISKKEATKTRKPPEYFIVSKGYWQGEGWVIDDWGIKTRQEAEAKVEQLEAKNPADHNMRYERRYEIRTKTQITKMFGSEWWSNLSHAAEMRMRNIS